MFIYIYLNMFIYIFILIYIYIYSKTAATTDIVSTCRVSSRYIDIILQMHMPHVTIQTVTIGAQVMAFEPLPSSAGLLRASLRFNDGGNQRDGPLVLGHSGCTDSNRCSPKVRIERGTCEHSLNSANSLRNPHSETISDTI